MNKLLKRLAVASLVVVTPVAAFAASPSPEEVKKVWDFYFKGQGQGIVLVEAIPCLEVAKEGEQKSECVKEVPAEGVKAGTTVMIWQAYLLPGKDSVDDITIQVKLGDQIRETKDVSKIEGSSIRTRTWSGVTLKKPGTYTFNIMRGADTLKTISITAN